MAKIDPRIIVTYGMTVLAAAFFMRAHLTAQADYFSIAIAMFVLGAGGRRVARRDVKNRSLRPAEAMNRALAVSPKRHRIWK